MKIPILEKKRNVTNLHGYEIIDDYSWVHQKDILEVLTDKKKLLPEVRDYLEKENDYTTFNLRDTKKTQDILFNEYLDFGDLTLTNNGTSGGSNGHGGLG